MKPKLQFALILFIFLSFVIPGFCYEGNDPESKIFQYPSSQNTRDTLIITLRDDLPPLSFLNIKGEPAGFFVDMWRLWADKTGQKIEFRATEWKNTLESLQNRAADIHGTLTYSEERARWMGFSQHFYELSLCVFFVKNREEFHNITDLKGLKTGITGGTIIERKMQQHYPEIDIVTFTAIEDLVHAAMDGKIRAFVSTSASVLVILRRLGLAGEFGSTDETLFPIKIHAGVLRENKELLQLTDKGLDAISHEELAEIESRWIPDPAKRYYRRSQIIRLTKTEETWMKYNKVVRVSIPVVFPPMMHLGEENDFQGMIPDYLNLISLRTGIRFDLVPASLSDLPGRVRTRQTDMFPDFINLQSDNHISLTDPCFSVAWIIVNRTRDPFVRNVKDLAGMKVSLVNNIPLYERVIKDYPEIRVHTIDNPSDGLRSVASGKTDAFIGALPVVGYLIRKHHLANLKIAGSAGYDDFLFRFAVRSDYPELTGILNKAIYSVSEHEHDAIFKRNMPVRFEHAADWQEIIKWTFGLSGIFIFIAGISLFWNRRLSKEVNERKRAEEAFRERVKELTCLYAVSHDIQEDWPVDELCRRAVGHLISGMQFPEITMSLIELNGKQFKSGNCTEDGLSHTLHAEIRVQGEVHGQLRVCYTEERPFLIPDEQNLINGIAEALSTWLNRKLAEEKLKEYSEHLEDMVRERTQELKKAQEELLLKERLAVLGHFAGSISHEIRNPLAAIDSSVYFLKMKLGQGNEKTRQHLERITANIHKSVAIIESLLNLTRMEKPNTEKTDLSDLVSETLRSAKIPETVEVILNLPDKNIFVDIDAEQVRMALKNIIKNAVQAMNEAGKLTVTAQSAEFGQVELSVSDTGPGIPSEHLGKVFEPLFSTKTHGIGFGLSITKMIIENHDGGIRAESGPESGAAFILTFPKKGG
ncbi:transporter substrate-binding domain-containing protein [Desulfobacterales bacterium HSG2]|nr:transporter substrate-binding domain-containing protein [Desulfobacterales bacterium HSG2]